MNWLVFALLSAFFAGLVAIFGKIGVTNVNSSLATAIRAVVMAMALVLLVAVRSAAGDPALNVAGLKEIAGRTWLFIFLAGLAGAVSWLCYFRALQLGDASRVAPIDRLSVLITILFGMLVLGERLSPTALVGAALVLGGSILIAVG